MGRSNSSSTSCFKIITCGSNSADIEDLDASENKSSADKRGWSFRKKSARHRVPSNSALSETLPSGTKESPEFVTVNFQTQVNSNIPDKTPGMQSADEKPESVNLKLFDTIAATEDDNKIDVTLDESVIIVIQAAIRGFLAHRALLKQKSIVKLQAAVRGLLVRRHAVGTLRCVQAIIKLQALVRARRTRLVRDRSSTDEKLNDKHGKDNHSSELLEKGNSETKSLVTYTSIEKLLSNRFALQLLESTPRTKRINIKCDPSKSDSAWDWLERWMSASSVRNEQSQKLQLSTEHPELEQVEHSPILAETVIPSDSCCKPPADSKSRTEKAGVTSEREEILITCDSDSFNFQACQPIIFSMNHSLEQLNPDSTGTSNSIENSLDSLPCQPKQPNPVSKMEPSSFSGVPEMECEPPKRVMKGVSSEQPEIEGKKIALGSRKASNPAFIGAQSKFEELSSAAHSIKSVDSLNRDIGVESYKESVSSATDNALETRDAGSADNSTDHNLRAQVGDSECFTELSVSSTIDSPDRSEAGARDFEQEVNISEDGKRNPKSNKGLDVEAKEESTILGADLSNSISVHPEKCEDSSQVEQKREKNASDMQVELKSETGHQVYKSSPDASPRSHITISEFQGTPCSQVSVKAEKCKSETSGSIRKPKSLSAGKSSFSNSNHDSGAKSSLELPPKDHKTGKWRNSFGSAKPDNVDQEPRDSSSSSNSLPNYMLATESARAKALANSSPRSSPDMQDKNIYIKKRHSLPGANGRQGSPRMQRSPSQAQQSAKGNDPHPRERKWQR